LEFLTDFIVSLV